MAAIQGSRLPLAGLATRPAPLAHVRRLGVERTVRRSRPAGLVLGFILVATLLGLVYQTQMLRSAAATVEIARLQDERAQLLRELRAQEAVILRSTSRPTVTEWALRNGLDSLGDTLILTVT